MSELTKDAEVEAKGKKRSASVEMANILSSLLFELKDYHVVCCLQNSLKQLFYYTAMYFLYCETALS